MKKLIRSNTDIQKDWPYQIVSMAAILRDYVEPKYVGKYHKLLVDVADSLYNVGRSIANDFLPEYKEVYDRMGAEYWDKVLDDMYAIDGQLTTQAKVDELLADYGDRLDSSALSFANASTKVTANNALTKDEIKNLWDNTALYVDFGDSDAMCQDNGYTLDQTLDFVDKGYSVYVDAATKVTASDLLTIYGDNGNLEVDMWYDDKFEPKKYGADAYFNDRTAAYWGWIYPVSE